MYMYIRFLVCISRLKYEETGYFVIQLFLDVWRKMGRSGANRSGCGSKVRLSGTASVILKDAWCV